jgi:hypothetical protein
MDIKMFDTIDKHNIKRIWIYYTTTQSPIPYNVILQYVQLHQIFIALKHAISMYWRRKLTQFDTNRLWPLIGDQII